MQTRCVASPLYYGSVANGIAAVADEKAKERNAKKGRQATPYVSGANGDDLGTIGARFVTTSLSCRMYKAPVAPLMHRTKDSMQILSVVLSCTTSHKTYPQTCSKRTTEQPCLEHARVRTNDRALSAKDTEGAAMTTELPTALPSSGRVLVLSVQILRWEFSPGSYGGASAL